MQTHITTIFPPPNSNQEPTTMGNNSLLYNLLLVSRGDRVGGWAKLTLDIVEGRLNVQRQL